MRWRGQLVSGPRSALPVVDTATTMQQAAVVATKPSDALTRLRQARGWILDMDGVLYIGQERLPGVQEFLDALALRERQVMLATNNSMATPKAYERKLADMGIEMPASSVITSALATRDYLV